MLSGAAKFCRCEVGKLARTRQGTSCTFALPSPELTLSLRHVFGSVFGLGRPETLFSKRLIAELCFSELA